MLNAFAEGHEGEINPLLPTLPDLVWGTLAFLIILALFIWKILPRLNEALDARAQAIEGSIKSAETAQAEAQAALEKYTAQLADARAEAGRIREQARTDGSAIIAELREQASSEAARITSNAQAQIEMERLAALASLRVGRGQPRPRPRRRRDRRDPLRGRQGAGRRGSLPRRARGL